MPDGIGLADLKRHHVSRPRNPIIADACFKAGYIDAWGRGTLKIINSCKDAGLPEPEIIEFNGGLLVTVFKDKYSSEQLNKMGLNRRQIRAVEYANEKGKITNKEYQTLNEVGKTTSTQELTELVEHGLFKAPTARGRGANYTGDIFQVDSDIFEVDSIIFPVVALITTCYIINSPVFYPA